MLEYATDLFERESVEALAGAARASAGGGGCGARSCDRAAGHSRARASGTRSCGSGTTPRVRSRPRPCRSCSPRRRRAPPTRSRWCSRTSASPMRSSMRAPTSWRIICAGWGSGLRSWWGLCVERSLEMVVGLLGILKAGGAYLPLDPEYPAERLHYMMKDAGARCVAHTQFPGRDLADPGRAIRLSARSRRHCG